MHTLYASISLSPSKLAKLSGGSPVDHLPTYLCYVMHSDIFSTLIRTLSEHHIPQTQSFSAYFHSISSYDTPSVHDHFYPIITLWNLLLHDININYLIFSSYFFPLNEYPPLGSVELPRNLYQEARCCLAGYTKDTFFPSEWAGHRFACIILVSCIILGRYLTASISSFTLVMLMG